jgi:hypothetical protein
LIANVTYDDYPGRWPSTFDRFSEIGKEVDYRTIYAALCSQAHNDPEDILNNFILRITEVDGSEKSLEIEAYIFSLDMVLNSIRYYIEASAMYLGKYQISATEKILPLLFRATELQFELQSNSKEYMMSPLQ